MRKRLIDQLQDPVEPLPTQGVPQRDPVPVCGMWTRLPHELDAARPQHHPFGSAAARLSALRQDLQAQPGPQVSHQPAHGRAAVPVPLLPQGLRQLRQLLLPP